MRHTAVLLCLASGLSSVAAFSPSGGQPISLMRKRLSNGRMSEGIPPALPSLTQLLNGVLFATSANGLSKTLPLLLSGELSDGLGGVALDALFLAVSSFSLVRSFAKVDYTELDGPDEGSFAREAGEWALAGEVPVLSKDGLEVATFAGGCFWGTELHFQRVDGVVATCVGYTQGAVERPNYEQVCSGSSGHTEGIQLTFDSSVISYEQLCLKLLSTMDATLLNRVGNDRGTQYRHGDRMIRTS